MKGSVRVGADGVARCWWCGDDPLYQRYHDGEWGRPLHGEDAVFEKLVLEGMQAGLSWITILRKREAFRAAFAGFRIAAVAEFGERDVARLLGDAAIVRNRAKIEAAIGNARAARAMLERGESLDALCWSFAPRPRGRPLTPRDEIPAATPESTALSKALLARGFRFVGPTTMYALMQSGGLVNDHLEGCASLAAT
ncbi:MAG TPA: DNA-3-methyladenine glycosylase I [Polyangiaceae bacterium]|nr:DNA-3-methyladenine glycosylase I [Polyangiaceae bacterium]